jgi:hypothetical protein
MDTELNLIKSPYTQEERIKARIDAFYTDIHAGDGDMSYIEDILAAVHDYLILFDDEDVVMSTFKLKEAIFYIAHFNKT